MQISCLFSNGFSWNFYEVVGSDVLCNFAFGIISIGRLDEPPDHENWQDTKLRHLA